MCTWFCKVLESVSCFFCYQQFQRAPLIFPEPEKTNFLCGRCHWGICVNRAKARDNGDPPPEKIQLRSHLAYLEFHAGQFRLLFSQQSLLKVKETFP